MLLVREYDEDPALFAQQDENHHHHLLAVNASLPRRSFQLDLSSKTVTIHPVPIIAAPDGRDNRGQSSWNTFWRTPRQVLVDLFLPLGFPHSVDSSYLPYQFYDSLQGLCSYLRGVVSNSALLKAAGVGDAEATSLGAAMTWAMKDGMGMIGGLVFSYHASPFFDAYVLEFRLFADLINDVALTLDMMAPLVPSSWLLGLMSLSTLSKTMCGMSAGATKSSITCHLALEGNMADLNAKEGTQETLVSLLGMILGVQLAKQLERLEKHYHDEPLTLNDTIPKEWQIPVEFAVSWIIFLFFTWLHMWANYRGVNLLKLKTLNRERARAALDGLTTSMADTYRNSSTSTSSAASPILDTAKIYIPSPDEAEESMIRATSTLLFPRQQSVALGMPLLEVLQSTANPAALLQEFKQERYIVGVRERRGSNQVLSTLRTGATSHDELKAFVHCMLLRKCLDRSRSSGATGVPISDTTELIQTTHIQLKPLFAGDESSDNLLIRKLAEQGWDTEARMYLGFGRKRTSWESKVD